MAAVETTEQERRDAATLLEMAAIGDGEPRNEPTIRKLMNHSVTPYTVAEEIARHAIQARLDSLFAVYWATQILGIELP